MGLIWLNFQDQPKKNNKTYNPVTSMATILPGSVWHPVYDALDFFDSPGLALQVIAAHFDHDSIKAVMVILPTIHPCILSA